MKPIPVTLELPDGVVRLAPLEPLHAPGLLDALGDGSIWRYMPTPTPRTVEDFELIIRQANEQLAAGTQVPFVILDRATSHPIGSTRFLDIQPANRSIEIGWTWIGARWQRTAANTQSKLLLLNHAFDTLNAVRVQFKADARNIQSQNAILRLGAVREGVLRKSRINHDGYIRDTVYFSILDTEWPSVKSNFGRNYTS